MNIKDCTVEKNVSDENMNLDREADINEIGKGDISLSLVFFSSLFKKQNIIKILLKRFIPNCKVSFHAILNLKNYFN